jgi:hypothetical protein
MAHSFMAVFCIMSLCYCCDRYICKPCIRKIKNDPSIFTPPTTPDSNHSLPYSPSSSVESYDPEDPLPSPATMKPDYSSSEDYIDIYNEYRNSTDVVSPCNSQNSR